MPLLDLSAELFFLVMDHIGSAYFHEDLRRLTISKEWYKYAQPTCYKQITITRHSLRRVHDAPNAAVTMSLLRSSLDALGVELLPERDVKEHSALHNGSETGPDIPLVDDLAVLVNTTKEAPKLRHLRISDLALDPRHGCGFIHISKLRPLFLATNLTVLNLDICAAPLLASAQHLCATISTLLASLTHLRLRLPIICADALKPPKDEDALRLTEVVVNLGLYAEPIGSGVMGHARPCCKGGKLKLYNDVKAQARALSEKMAAPTKFRLLTWMYPWFKVRSLDVLTGRHMDLDEGADWGDDGQLDESGSESDEESLIVSSDDDDSVASET